MPAAPCCLALLAAAAACVAVAVLPVVGAEPLGAKTATFTLRDTRGVSAFARPRRARRDADADADAELDLVIDVIDAAPGGVALHLAYHLCRVGGVFGADTYITEGGRRQRLATAHQPVSYTSCAGGVGGARDRAVVTFIDSHTIRGAVAHGKDIFDVDNNGGAVGDAALRIERASSGVSASAPCESGHDDDHGRASGGGAAAPPVRARRLVDREVDPGDVDM